MGGGGGDISYLAKSESTNSGATKPVRKEERTNCDFHGKLIIINQILWHGTSEQRHSLTYTSASLYNHQKKLRTKVWHRICDTEIPPCVIPPPCTRCMPCKG